MVLITTKHIQWQFLDIMLFYLYFCHLFEFSSHLTGEPQSREITDNNSPNKYNVLCIPVYIFILYIMCSFSI